MTTLRIQYSYTPNLMPQPSGIDGKLPIIYGRVVRNYDSNGKPIESLRKLNGKSPRVLPTANAELYAKIHERAVALGEKALDQPLTDAELAGFNMLTANFFTHNGVENALVDVTVDSTPINRANPKVVANLKGLRELCKRLGVEFTLDMAKKLENINFTYLCDHIVEITKTETKSFAINDGNDKDYSDFENMWDDEDDDFEDEDDDFDGETESNTQPDAAALAEAAKKAKADAAKAAKKAQAQGSGKKPNVKA